MKETAMKRRISAICMILALLAGCAPGAKPVETVPEQEETGSLTAWEGTRAILAGQKDGEDYFEVTGEEKTVLHARDKAAVGGAVVKAANEALGGGRLTLAEETGDFAGGLILRRESIEVNCTAELLVKVCRDEMSAKMADVLFA